jgi:hypothetical protein
MKSLSATAHGAARKVLNRRKETPHEPLERIRIQSPRFDQPLQDTYFLRGHTHSLAKCRIESTDHIAERQ